MIFSKKNVKQGHGTRPQTQANVLICLLDHVYEAPFANNINFLLTEREGRTGEYWPEVMAVQTELSEVRTKTTEGQYFPVRLELDRLVSSLLYGTQGHACFEFAGFRKKKIHSR